MLSSVDMHSKDFFTIGNKFRKKNGLLRRQSFEKKGFAKRRRLDGYRDVTIHDKLKLTKEYQAY